VSYGPAIRFASIVGIGVGFGVAGGLAGTRLLTLAVVSTVAL
jgi:hypothetical protein